MSSDGSTGYETPGGTAATDSAPTDAGGPDSDSGTTDGPVADCPDEPGGFAVGEIAENWTLLDRSGEEVSLYDYCGKIIVFEDGAEW